VKELSWDNFNQYGSFANMVNPDAYKIGGEPTEFFRDIVLLNLGQSGPVGLSTCRVLKRPLVITAIEYHDHTGEGMLPLDGDVILYFAPASPKAAMPLDEFEAFRVPMGTAVTIKPGVWHCGPFADGKDCVNVLIILPERTYANDCVSFDLTEEQQITIEGC